MSDWIEWRDRETMGQIKKFARFVDYWMERFDKLNDDRIFISYETLTDDNEGPEEAIRITNFLARSKGVEPIPIESVPCVWRAVVKYKKKASDSEKNRRRLDPEHHDSQRSGPTERPYTPELLDAMSKMLLGLIQKWGDRHLRLRKTLEGYQQSVHAAYLEAVGKSSVTKSFHIFQASPPHTGSAVLNNLLVGLFDAGADFKKSSIVTKTHDFDLLGLYKQERLNYDEIFFVASNEGADDSKRISKDLCEYNNVLCIEHEELLYNNQQDLRAVVDSLATKVQKRFEYFFGQGFIDDSKKLDAMRRIESLDNAVASLGGDQHSGAQSVQVAKVKPIVNGKSFHIFQASPAQSDTYQSTVLTNWLMGLFEPDQDYSFMIHDLDHTVRQHGVTVPIDTVSGLLPRMELVPSLHEGTDLFIPPTCLQDCCDKDTHC